ncbi:hypothetical protein O3P69_017291 [Scylla paramamosain]|uniref:HAT C-terminal dimerisation domain-containing protein n=1 Tax=Scylla paramamosain TaxID=85552 RepID=A0AAW0TVE9_SCYPA
MGLRHEQDTDAILIPAEMIGRVNKGIKVNLKSHFNRIHPGKANQVNKACMANIGTGSYNRNQYGQSADACNRCRLWSPSSRGMVHTLNPSKEVPSGRTLGRILKIYEEMKESLTSCHGEEVYHLLAIAFHPKFCLKWMGAFGFEFDERRWSSYRILPCSISSSSKDMEMEDYFTSICDEEVNKVQGCSNCEGMAAGQKGTESLVDPAFNSEEVFINLFLRYNTAMPSSAMVECLFSLGKDIIRAKRSSLSLSLMKTSTCSCL